MNFNNLRKQNQKTQKELADTFNVSQNTIHSWENGRQEPNTEKLKEIADFFNVDINYLLGYDHNPQSSRGEQLSKSEKELLAYFRSLDEYGQERVIGYTQDKAESATEKQQKKKA